MTSSSKYLGPLGIGIVCAWVGLAPSARGADPLMPVRPTAPLAAPAQGAAPGGSPSAARPAGPGAPEVAQDGAKTGAVTGGAAEASRVAATGSFKAPGLASVVRPNFGSKAGKATAYPAIVEPVRESSLFYYFFACAAALALMLTALTAFRLSLTTKRDGTRGRAMTVGTRLAGGFGILVTGILALAMLSRGATATIVEGMSEVAHFGRQDTLVSDVRADITDIELQRTSFLASHSEADLAACSNALASLVQKHDLAKQTIRSADRVQLLETMGAGIAEYARRFAEVVKLIDQRDAVVDTQMGGAATRGTVLLTEIARTARSDGDLDAVSGGAEANQTLQEARLAFFEYLRTSDETLAKKSAKLARETNQRLGALGTVVANPKRKAWLKEAGGAVEFWIGRLEQAQRLQHECNAQKASLATLGVDMTRIGSALSASLVKSRDESAVRTAAAAASSKLLIAGLAGTIALLGAVLAFVIARSVIKPLSAMIARITEIRETTDLTRRVEVSARDEIGRLGDALNSMVQTLHDNRGVQIDAGGSQIASASQTPAQGVSEQASRLAEISASLEQIPGPNQQSDENARQVNTLSQDGGRRPAAGSPR